VSLLAEARGHRPKPSVATLQDLRQRHVLRLVSDELTQLMQRSLGRLQSDEFVLSIYFGRPLAKTHAALARALFDQFPAPLLRARFERDPQGTWSLEHLGPIGAADVPPHHRDVLVSAAESYFAHRL